MARSHTPLEGRIAVTALLVLLMVAPLARGSVRPWVQFAELAIVGAAALALSRRDLRTPWATPLLFGAFLVAALQPLLALAGWPASLDPPASGRDLSAAGAPLLAFAAAAAVADSRRQRSRLVMGLGLAGGLVAVAALAASLLGVASFTRPGFPFVNPNHLAGLLNLTAFVALALAVREVGTTRLAWLAAFALMVTVLLLSLSRGGIAAFLGGLAIFVALATWRGRRAAEDQPPRDWRKLVVAGLLGACALVAYAALDPLLGRLATLQAVGDDVKLGLWRPALRLLADHPWLGIGRGAFATAFAAYKEDPGQVTFTHLENQWLQPLIDLGIPAGLLMVATPLLVWLAAVRRRELSTVEIGLLSGTAAVAAQNLVDFSLQFNGVGLPFMVALGLLTAGGAALRIPRAVAAVGVVAILLSAGAGLALWYLHPTDNEAWRVADVPTTEEAEALARVAGRWHPADYLPPAILGGRLVEADRCAAAMPWLTQAMRLNPTAPEPHLHAARCLSADGQDRSARREYRLAFLYGRPEALGEAADRWDSVGDLREVAPDDAGGLIAMASALTERARHADAAVLLRVALEEFLDDRAMVPLAQALATSGELEEALALARRREETRPQDPAGWSVAASVLQRLERPEEAVAEARRGLEAIPGAPQLITFLAQQAYAAGRFGEGMRIAQEMSIETPVQSADRELLVAQGLAGQGRLSEAIDRAQTAAGILPDSTRPLGQLVTYLARARRFEDAISAAEHARGLDPNDGARWDDVIGRIKESQQANSAREQERDLLKGR